MVALQGQVAELQARVATAASNGMDSIARAVASAGGTATARLEALQQDADKVLAGAEDSRSKLLQGMQRLAQQQWTDTQDFFAAHCDSVVNQVTLNNKAVLDTSGTTLEALTAKVVQALEDTTNVISRCERQTHGKHTSHAAPRCGCGCGCGCGGWLQGAQA